MIKENLACVIGGIFVILFMGCAMYDYWMNKLRILGGNYLCKKY